MAKSLVKLTAYCSPRRFDNKLLPSFAAEGLLIAKLHSLLIYDWNYFFQAIPSTFALTETFYSLTNGRESVEIVENH